MEEKLNFGGSKKWDNQKPVSYPGYFQLSRKTDVKCKSPKPRSKPRAESGPRAD